MPNDDANDITRAMLLIKAMDDDAKVLLSTYTGKWYVSARIEISRKGMLSSITEHRPTPDAAILAYLAVAQNVGPPDVLVVRAMSDTRAEYRWNGVAFTTECTAVLS